MLLISTTHRLTKLIAISLILAFSGLAKSEININGFATVGGGFYSGEDGSTEYEGFDQDKFAADPINRVGLQFSVAVNDKITATAQLLAKGNNGYDVDAEWAYLSYAATDQLEVRVGRLRSPFFHFSDFLDVGFAYPWVTPPDEVYRFLFDTIEGMDVLYSSNIGDWDYTAQAYYARLTDDTFLGDFPVKLDLRNFFGANIVFTRDWLTLRASYNDAEVTISTPEPLETGLYQPLRQFGFGDVVNSLETVAEDGYFWGVSAQIDYENWLLNVEYTELSVDNQSLISNDKAYYILVGRRFDEFTLHVTYSKQEDDPDFSIVESIPAQGPSAALRFGAQSQIQNEETEAIIYGVRYDFAPATALKFEITDLDFESIDQTGTLVTFAIDTVF